MASYQDQVIQSYKVIMIFWKVPEDIAFKDAFNL